MRTNEHRVPSGFERKRIRPDTVAALSLWAVLVPQALAYGDLAGLEPVTGLYTAFGGMLLYALFGSSRYLNVGPESSVAIVVAASVASLAGGDEERYVALAATMALLVAGFLIVGALLRLGGITRLLSTPILAGYLAGSGIIIIANQLAKIFGVRVAGDEWYEKTVGVAGKLGRTNLWALAMAAAVLAGALIIHRVAPRLPAFLIVLMGATLFVAVTGIDSSRGVDVVGTVEPGIPIPGIPDVEFADVVDLLAPAASVALLVFASSAAAGGALAARDGDDLRPRREFFGLAAANAAAGLLQSFPANGSDSRSFVIAASGGRSQMVNIVGAGLVLVTLVALTPLFEPLPDAALGAVVVVSALGLFDLKGVRRLWRARRSDFVLAFATFAGVLIVGVLPGIVVGVIVSLLEVLRRAILPNTAVLGRVAGAGTYRDVVHYRDATTVPGVIVYRFDAPLFFANADVFRNQILTFVDEASVPVRTVVVDAEGITDLDVTGAEILQRVVDDLRARDVRLVLARVRTDLRSTMVALGVEERIGSGNFYLEVRDAVGAASGTSSARVTVEG